MPATPDSLVIGGGLIGMLTARELALAGQSVCLLERGEIGRESSWAGGGILSPLYPWRYADPVSELARLSQQLYPDLVPALYEASGIDPEWRHSGLLMPGCDEADDARRWADKFSVNLQEVDREEALQIAPELAPTLAAPGALWLPEVGQVRNPRFVAALRGAIESIGVEIVTNAQVTSLNVSKGILSGVTTADGRQYTAGQTVLAGGAWSGELLAPLGLELPVQPVRGQMLLYRTTPGTVNRIILNKERYVIPRRDGRVLVGSTLEHTGFDKHTTVVAREELEAEARRIVPALAGFPVEKHWAGLRPGSPDGLPFIGACPGVEGLFLNTGHYRNGVILGPASAALLAAIMLGKPAPVPARAYDPAQLLTRDMAVVL